MKNLYKIGVVAKIFKISISTLRHYENIGLLKPKIVDADSGYRYYDIEQFEKLNTIKYLRALDMPLENIIDFFNNKDVEKLETLLIEQKKVILQKKTQLDYIEKKINDRLYYLKNVPNSNFGMVTIKTVPERRIIYSEENLSPISYLDLENSLRKLDVNTENPIIFPGKVGLCISKENLLKKEYSRYNKIFIVIENSDNYTQKTGILPQETCVAIKFCGTHKDAPQYYEILYRYIQENCLVISDDSREVTLIDECLTPDNKKFVTEIQIPIRRNNDEKI